MKLTLFNLLASWVELEPDRCAYWGLIGENGHRFHLTTPDETWVVQLPLHALYEARLQWAVQRAIENHRLRVSLDFHPHENGGEWVAQLFLATDIVSDPNRDWKGTSDQAAVALLTAYIACLKAIGGEQ